MMRIMALFIALFFALTASAEPRIYYVHNDHNGAPLMMTDQNQHVVWKANYTPFGKAIIEVEEVELPVRYKGQYYDKESGLHYNYFRDYNPNTGRYLQSDPIGLAGGLNTYAYVGGNPFTWVDPYGLSGTLTINSSGNGHGASGSGGFSGHSWINYTPDTGSSTTYGTWGNNPNNLGNGLQKNLEQGRVGDASRSLHLDDTQEGQLMDLIDMYQKLGGNGWSYSEPCSTFATDAWKAGTGESLSPFGPYSNPSTLKDAIIKANGGVNHR